MKLTIDRRFRGPATSGNGGYVAGRLAARLDIRIVTVTLRRPPPLEAGLEVRGGDGRADLLEADGSGGTLVAEAVAGDLDVLVDVPPVSTAEAAQISLLYPGLRDHPFPECFVCGPHREPGDGLRLFPGRTGDGRTACVWTVGDDVADDECFVWAALDCPGGWSAPIEGRPMVLGRMTAEIDGTPGNGDECVVMGQLLGSEGRKTWTATTVYGPSGRRLGRAHATWITLPS